MREFVSIDSGVSGVRAEDSESFGQWMEKGILKRQKRKKLVAIPREIYVEHWHECAEESGTEPFRIWLSPDVAVILTSEPTTPGFFECVILWRTSDEVSRIGRRAADLETLAAGVQAMVTKLTQRATAN